MNPTLSYTEGFTPVKLKESFELEPHLSLLLEKIAALSGKAILVGGCVRDHLLGHHAKDIDIEVYGVPLGVLEKMLTSHFSVVAVGKTFGIFKVSIAIGPEKKTFDVALPRTENKEGQGHKGFIVATDPHLSFKEASRRRDFTINAMGIDVLENTLWDPHEGARDLEAHRLRHVSLAFSEDPLRVLRAAQFCARFCLTLDQKTVELAKTLRDELSTLSKERVFAEFKKLLLSKKPSLGLEVLRVTEALVLTPDLARLIGCQQEQEWHPEGDVWIHSLMVTDAAAKIIRQHDLSEDDQLIVMAGALCHDFGKPATTILKDGRIKSPSHEEAGEEPTRSFLTAVGFPKRLHDLVVPLVKEHLKPHQLYRSRDEVKDSAIRRLAARVNVDHLLLVSEADFLGRTTKDAVVGYDPSAPWLRQKLTDLLGEAKSPQPLLLGRHLIMLGEKPGSHFSKILDDAFTAQLEGEFSDEESALEWLKNRLAVKKS